MYVARMNLNIEFNSTEKSSYILCNFADNQPQQPQQPQQQPDVATGNSWCRQAAHASKVEPPRQKINARERYRTFNVNAAYEALRELIPTEPINRRLSKIEIIRLASSYIKHLRSTLQTGTDRQPCLLHKWEHSCAGGSESGALQRITVCTFCMKPKNTL